MADCPASSLDRREGRLLLAANGQPLAVPVTVTERQSNGRNVLAAALTLSSLFVDGQHVVEVTAGSGADSEQRRIAIRVMQHTQAAENTRPGKLELRTSNFELQARLANVGRPLPSQRLFSNRKSFRIVLHAGPSRLAHVEQVVKEAGDSEREPSASLRSPRPGKDFSDRDLMRLAVVSADGRRVDRHVFRAVIEIGRGIPAGLHQVRHEHVGVGDSAGRVVHETWLARASRTPGVSLMLVGTERANRVTAHALRACVEQRLGPAQTPTSLTVRWSSEPNAP